MQLIKTGCRFGVPAPAGPDGARIRRTMKVDIDLAVILGRADRRDSSMHGEEHWRCVAATGLDLVAADGDRQVVFAFGLLHDTRRRSEGRDPDHGRRAASLARELHSEELLALTTAQLELLCHACDLHADGHVSNDPTVGACWDADRLHLPRVGFIVDSALLSTATAREPERVEQAAAHRVTPPAWAQLLDALASASPS